MVYGLLRALPGDRLVDTVTGEKLRPLDACTEASGPHGLAVRKPALSSGAPLTSTAARPAFVTFAKRPSSRTGWRRHKADLGRASSINSENQKNVMPSLRSRAHSRHRRLTTGSFDPGGSQTTRPVTMGPGSEPGRQRRCGANRNPAKEACPSFRGDGNGTAAAPRWRRTMMCNCTSENLAQQLLDSGFCCTPCNDDYKAGWNNSARAMAQASR